MDRIREFVKHLPLREMDGTLLSYEILDEAINHKLNLNAVNNSIRFASYLHRNDIRGGGGILPDNYINHPLRNTVRIMRYGCFQEDIIIASILHDIVEDHAFDIVSEFTTHDLSDIDVKSQDGQIILAEFALKYIQEQFGYNVSRIVNKVSNKPNQAGLSREEQRAVYIKHVAAAITDDPEVFMVKFSDFSDNAIDLHHNVSNVDMVSHLSRKYFPLIPYFRSGIQSLSLLVYPASKNEMLIQLQSGAQTLAKMLK